MPDPSPLWLIDRSRVVDGRGFCQRARYLGYHAGPDGYGMALKATRLPLMTGIGAHDGVAPILEWCRDHDPEILEGLRTISTPQEEHYLAAEAQATYLPVPRDVVRAAVAQACAAYWKVVGERGFAYLSASEEVQSVTREQQYLITGLIWSWCLEVLPEILHRGRILEVEHEGVFVFACTCGLGDGIGTQQDHESRGCQGIGLMCRPDFLVESRTTHELEYHEIKTTSMDSPMFRDKWEVMLQLFSATIDAERRHGKQVGSVYIHGLIKGKRQGEYLPETKRYDGPPYQHSPFCYGWRKPAMPPMEREQWGAEYTRLKGWSRAGVWDLPDAWIPEGMDKAEYWSCWLPSEVRRKQLVVLGPFTRQTQMVEHFFQEAIGEEWRWREGLWSLYELAQEMVRDDGATWVQVWQSSEFQRTLDRLFPRSYECRRFGRGNTCQFEDLCFEREAFLDPLGGGRYIPRAPHHEPERVQLQARGLAPTSQGLIQEGED